MARSRILLAATAALAIPVGLCAALGLGGDGHAPVALMTFAVAAFTRPVP